MLFRVVSLALLWSAWADAGVISGTVVENRTSRPLARTRVSLLPPPGAAAKGPLTVLTGSGGEFNFDGLGHGAYRLRAEREGFAPVEYGQRRFGEPGTPIVVEAGGHFAAELRLARLGAITGDVLDENGVGLPGVPVYALSAGKRWKAAAIANTNDRGAYRLAGLSPGRYVVRTAAKGLTDGSGLLPTYHGQTAVARQAKTIELRLDQEVTGIDVTPQTGRLGRISGVVPPGIRQLVLITETGVRDARIGTGGRFEFEELEPGTYELLANPSPGNQQSGFTGVVLGAQDATVPVDVGPSPTLAVRCLSAGGTPPDAKSISVFLRRTGMEDSNERLACGEKKLWGPGRWELGVIAPPQYYVSSLLDASSGGQTHDLLLRPRESKEITVLLGGRPASLRGKVLTSDGVPAPGAPVFLNAVTSDLQRRVGGTRLVRADPDGVYSFVGLPPGEYEVLSAFHLVAEEAWPAGAGTPIRLAEGEEAVLEVRVAAARD